MTLLTEVRPVNREGRHRPRAIAVPLRRQFFDSALVALLVASCSAPVNFASGPYRALDEDTQYHVADRPGGFVISVEYSRYQFIPSATALIEACRSALTSAAYQVAEQRGRRIAPINEQRIRVDTGRNIVTAVSSCTATVPVEYQ